MKCLEKYVQYNENILLLCVIFHKVLCNLDFSLFLNALCNALILYMLFTYTVVFLVSKYTNFKKYFIRANVFVCDGNDITVDINTNTSNFQNTNIGISDSDNSL